MAFGMIGLFVVLFFSGLVVQSAQVISAGPAGVVAAMESIALVRGQYAQVFASACIDAASAAPGLISSDIAVVLPQGVNRLPFSNCMTAPGDVGGRKILASSPGAGGAMTQIVSASGNGATWYRVTSIGVATNVISGEQSVVPSTIPAGSLLDWIQTSN